MINLSQKINTTNMSNETADALTSHIAWPDLVMLVIIVCLVIFVLIRVAKLFPLKKEREVKNE